MKTTSGAYECVAIIALAFVLGCAEQRFSADVAKSSAESSSLESFGQGMARSSKSSGQEKELDSLATANRKIIYSAEASIVVEDFAGVPDQVKMLVERFDGFIADAKLNTRNRKRRSGKWTVRIPVVHFDDFLASSGDIGVTVARSRNAQDVTEEYVDVESRIKNKQKLEARILQLLGRRDDKIQHVIEVERELGRVREEIERMQGRIRYFKDRIELTTVSLSITEEQAYRPAAATGFSDRISQAWNGSLTNTRRGCENFVVWLVGNVLPLLFYAIVAMVIWYVFRNKIRRLFEAPVAATADTE